jgi:hypothetical protein
MKKVLAVVFAAAFLCVASFGAQAQTPYAQVYFDNTFQQTAADCPGDGVQQFLYVVYHNVSAFMSSTQFKVTYPAELIWMGEATSATVTIGNSFLGAKYGWPIPVNGYAGPMVVAEPFVEWYCDDCTGGTSSVVVTNYAGGAGNELKLGTYPDATVEIYLVGMTSLICPDIIPVKTQTWGAIKSLYSE